MNKNNIIEILRQHGFKVTPPRIDIYSVLLETKQPISAEGVFLKVKNKKINNVTVYRTLASFVEKGMLRQVDLRRDAVCYELKDDHHHHIVCNGCGDVEDIDLCLDNQTVSGITKQSKKFSSIEDHSLEFFGTCKKCIKK